MDVTYVAGKDTTTVSAEDNPHILVADHGSYVFLGSEKNTSVYNGVALLDLSSYKLHKVIHDIRPEKCNNPELIVYPKSSVRSTRHIKERFFFHQTLFCYELSGKGSTHISLDVRDMYDMNTEGREHHLSISGEFPWTVRIESRGEQFVLLSTVPVSIQNTWKEVHTPYDERRGGSSSWWIVDGVTLTSEGYGRVVLAPANREQEAKTLLGVDEVWEHKPKPFATPLSLSVAEESLSHLITRTPNKESGILAGLPWFFQIWTRDEAISVGALLAQKKFKLAGKILLREIGILLPNGQIPNRFPSSEVGSADGIGWAFVRLEQLYNQSRDTLTAGQWGFVKDQLKESLRRLRQHSQDGLVINEWKETWMDTTGGFADGRPGARIEIQGFTLAMLRFCETLCDVFRDNDKQEFTDMHKEMLKTTRDLLYDEKRNLLHDGYVDNHADGTIRPNIFLAHYAYPELLTKKQWEGIIDRYLDHLHIPWGGISSIDKEHLLFHEMHTGSNNKSYHRGDVWYFLNNIVAICLVSFGDRYMDAAHAIRDASLYDMFCLGAVGHCSEISSAHKQEPLGCWCQAWSASTLVELEYALQKRDTVKK